MIELLLTLTTTPLPALLAVAGLILLFLGIVGYIEQLKIQPMPLPSRIAAGIVGVILLMMAIGLYLVPTLVAGTPPGTDGTGMPPVTEAIQPTEDGSISTGPTEAATEGVEETNAEGYPIMTDAKGALMVRLPAGFFMMGSENGYTDEQPVHRVELTRDTWIDVYEVSNAQYKACVDAGKCDLPSQINSNQRQNYFADPAYANFPVIYISWEMAKIFCEDWRGGRLPTEAEWEYAARGTDLRKYPWGNDSATCELANFNLHDDLYCTADTGSVNSHPQGVSPFGLYNMSGNVWEWVQDGYDSYAGLPLQNPLGVGAQQGVMRGGSWYSKVKDITATVRYSIVQTRSDFTSGFRCAATP